MINYILRRLLYMLVILFVEAGITFILMHSVPGEPFDKEKKLPPEIQANKEKYYHLEDPVHHYYAASGVQSRRVDRWYHYYPVESDGAVRGSDRAVIL